MRERRLRAAFIGESSEELGPAPRAVHRGTVGRRLYRKVLAVGARRLRKRLRRFLPASAGGALGAVRLGAALAGSAFEQGMGAAGRAVTDEQRTKLTDDASCACRATSSSAKPRADGAVGVYRAARAARAGLLWQLNDVLLSKSMLAHATRTRMRASRRWTGSKATRRVHATPQRDPFRTGADSGRGTRPRKRRHMTHASASCTNPG